MKRYIKPDWASELHDSLKDVDTSDWSKMQTQRQEDEIRDAGGYSSYIRKPNNESHYR